jgi:hypothetical protein
MQFQTLSQLYTSIAVDPLIRYARITAASDIPVTLIERHPRILDFVDQQLVEALSYHMRSQGVTFRLGEEVEEVTKSSEGKVCARLKADSGRLTRATHVNCCNKAWPLKSSISQNRSKKLCVRRPCKRFPLVFLDIILSLKFSLFCEEWRFFNSAGEDSS